MKKIKIEIKKNKSKKKKLTHWSPQKVHFQILILRSTLHLAPPVLANAGDFPFGSAALIPSHVTLIPTFLLLNPSIFTSTLVSISSFNGTPPFFFRSDLNPLTESESRSCDVETRIARKVVRFLLALVKAGTVPFPIKTPLSLVRQVTENGS